MALSKYAQKLQDYLKMYNLLAGQYKTRVNNKVASIGDGKGLFSEVLEELILEEGDGVALAIAIEADIINTLWDQFNKYGDGLSDFVLANLNAFNVLNGITVSVTTQGVTGITGAAEVTNITCLADVSDSLNGKYFTINSPSTAYYVWYKTSGGSLSDPAVGGKTGIQVSVATNATAAQVATATALAIDGLAAFVSPAPTTAVITVTNAVFGVSTDATAGNISFGISVTTQGVNTVSAVAEVTNVTLSHDVNNSLNGKYFLLNSPSTSYYVWFKTSGTIESLDPTIAGKTGIKVNIATNATATQVAIATAAAIDLLATFATPVPSTPTITVTNSVTGATVDAVGDGLAVTPTNFIMSQGSLVGFNTLGASADNSDNAITVTWVNNAGTGNALASDKAYAVWYNVTQNYWDSAANIAARSAGTMTIPETAMNTSDVLQVYVAFRKLNGTLVSASQRVQVTVAA